MTHPVTVVDDDGIRSRQVDPEPPCARAEQKREQVGIPVEVRDVGLAVRTGHGTVDAAVAVPALLQVVGEQVKHAGHLRKDEHLQWRAIQVVSRVRIRAWDNIPMGVGNETEEEDPRSCMRASRACGSSGKR